MTARIKPRCVVPPIAAIAPDRHAGCLAHIRHAGNATRTALGHALGLANRTLLDLGGLVGPDRLRLDLLTRLRRFGCLLTLG